MSTRARDLAELMSHGRWIQRLALQLVRDPHAADDLVQETWLAALKHPPRRADTRAWLGTVLRNFARQRLRRESAGRHREEAQATPKALPSSMELLERAETQRVLVESVMALDDPYRSTLLMHFYEGLSSAEIARQRGVSDSTVRAQVRRGLEQLRASLDRRHEGEREAWTLALAPLCTNEAASAPGGLSPLGKLVTAVATLSTAALITAVMVVSIEGARPTRSGNAVVAAAMPGVVPSAADPTSLPQPATDPAAAARTPVLGGDPSGSGNVAQNAMAPSMIAGRVLDAETGLPVPYYYLYLYDRLDNPEWELISTDEHGHFQSGQAWPAGPMHARLVDHEEGQSGDQVTSWTHADGDSSELEFVARVGPTFTLDFDLPSGLAQTDFVAMAAQQLLSIQGDANDIAFVAPVRAGSPAWVRFTPLAVANIGAGPPWRLDLVSRDGLHTGNTSIEQRTGVDPDLYRIELADRASIRGHVLDGHGNAIRYASMGLLREGAPPTYFRSRADIWGAYQFHAVPPGNYTLHGDLDGIMRGEAPVSLELLRRTEFDLVLARLPVAAPISGVVRSETGTFQRSVFIRLQPVGGGGLAKSRVQWSSEAGAMVGRFSFNDVPELPDGQTAYQLWTQRDDMFTWEGDECLVGPGETGIEMLVKDDVATFAFGFRVLDDRTGEPLPIVRASFGVGTGPTSGARQLKDVRFDEIVLPVVPESADLQWTVRAAGFAPAYGSSAGLEVDDDRRLASVRLQPGWGARFYLFCEETVDDARLSFDGQEYGIFGPQDYIDVTLPERPEHVSVTANGWVVKPNSSITDEGLFDDTSWQYIPIWLVRSDS